MIACFDWLQLYIDPHWATSLLHLRVKYFAQGLLSGRFLVAWVSHVVNQPVLPTEPSQSVSAGTCDGVMSCTEGSGVMMDELLTAQGCGYVSQPASKQGTNSKGPFLTHDWASICPTAVKPHQNVVLYFLFSEQFSFCKCNNGSWVLISQIA